MSSFLTDELKTLASSYSVLNSQTNKLWSFSAFLLLSVIAIEFDENSSASLLGIPVSQTNFYLGVIFISVFLNFAYCSSHIVNYRMAELYGAYVKQMDKKDDIFAKTTNKEFSNEDFAHHLYNSNNNRFYPIKVELDSSVNFSKIQNIWPLSIIFNKYKIIVDFVYSSVPFLACLIAVGKLLVGGKLLLGIPLLFIIGIFALPPWWALISLTGQWFKLRHKG